MSMFAAARSAWALFLGLAFLMLGNGLQGTLLGVRATLEGFSTEVTGVLMTGYFSGFLLGSTLGPWLVKNVGHIRVFAALASIFSAAILLHSVFIDPLLWLVIRLTCGFAMAGLYVVVESWLNDTATNETRGQLLSLYMVVVLGGMAAGQLLLNLADPGSFELFVLLSVLVSVSLVPISLTVSRAPEFETPSHIGWRALYRGSPLGVFGCLMSGVAHATLMGMGAVYAKAMGMPVADIALFMAAAMGGGVILQLPIGRISDVLDRRIVITVVTLLAATVALVGALAGDRNLMLMVVAFFFGGLSFPVYSLSIAHTNDHLAPEQMVAASGRLILVAGVGASLGPVMAASLMANFGTQGFFWTLFAAHGLIGVFALYRMTRRAPVPTEDQHDYVPLPARSSPMAAGISSSGLRDQRDRDLARLSGR